MTKPTITAMPTAPDRTDAATFDTRADPWLTALAGMPAEVNALVDYVENQAEIYSDVTWWVSGGSYSQYDAVFDPADGGTYRAKTTHSGVSTAPSADSTNWESAGGVPASSQAKLDLLSVTAAVDLDELRTTRSYTANGAITAGETVVLETAGTVKALTPSPSDADDWLGFAKNTVADGEEVDLATPGDLVTGLSSLTINSDYYLDDDGTFTISDTGRKVGIALSATSILITEGNAA